MKDKKAETDRTKAAKVKESDVAVKVARLWAQQIKQRYTEPVRPGTPKGDPIGLSLPKYEAALLQVLHPNRLRLREIAKMVGVSEGVLKFWRTETEFLEVVRQTSVIFGEAIANTIIRLFYGEEVVAGINERPFLQIGGLAEDDRDIGHWLIRLIPFYNGVVGTTIFAALKEDLEKNLDPLRWGILCAAIEEAVTVYDDESRRKFESTPGMLLLTKTTIANDIDLLVDPETWKQKSPEEIQKDADEIKEWIFRKLDILAK
jgi:hypothetical protein